MGKFIDLTGQRFGKLVVKERALKDGHKGAYWLCQCDCGKTAIVAGSKLRSGHTQSCGCLQRERTSKANKKFNTFRTVGGIVYVKMSNTEKEMLVDSDIWEKLKNYCWYENTLGYAASKDYGAKKCILFHVTAFPNCPRGLVRNHIDGNKLNNQRKNIRVIPQEKNCKNQVREKATSSGRNGVSFDSHKKKWNSYITLNGNRKNLGYFQNLDDAIKAREEAEIEYFGEYRRK